MTLSQFALLFAIASAVFSFVSAVVAFQGRRSTARSLEKISNLNQELDEARQMGVEVLKVLPREALSSESKEHLEREKHKLILTQETLLETFNDVQKELERRREIEDRAISLKDHT